jgi:EAL domain-containing protein (putative c-di-GMP-specific phosphodiesterase class I)
LLELKQRFKISFSLDDYGKWWANMVRLQKLLSEWIIQEVKLDPMLITAIWEKWTLIEAKIQTLWVQMIVWQAEIVRAKVTAEKVDSAYLMKLLKNMWVHTVQWFDTSGKPQRTPLVVPTLKQEKIWWKERVKLVWEIYLTKLKKRFKKVL